MNIENICPICGNMNCYSHWACVSRFLKERMFDNRAPKGFRLLRCEHCDFYFFNIRPEDAEMQRFYSEYRGEEYQRQREKWEPKYTAEFNAALGAHPLEVANRIAIMESVLTRNGISYGVDVLDFGGNEGRLIPEKITGAKYCYDLSGNVTVPGVRKITCRELKAFSYGLIMLQHVLEHVSYPVKFLRENIAPLMKEGSYLYIELPCEEKLLQPILEKNSMIYFAVKNRLKLYRPDWLLPSLPPLLGPVFHEHLNIFTL